MIKLVNKDNLLGKKELLDNEVSWKCFRRLEIEDINPEDCVIYKDKYVIAKSGRVFNRKTGTEFKGFKSIAGYTTVSIFGKHKGLHLIVLEAFVGKPKGECDWVVDHINNDKSDNRLENLQWLTRSENMNKYWKQKNNGEWNGEWNEEAKNKRRKIQNKYQQSESFKAYQKDYYKKRKGEQVNG